MTSYTAAATANRSKIADATWSGGSNWCGGSHWRSGYSTGVHEYSYGDWDDEGYDYSGYNDWKRKDEQRYGYSSTRYSDENLEAIDRALDAMDRIAKAFINREDPDLADIYDLVVKNTADTAENIELLLDTISTRISWIMPEDDEDTLTEG